MDPDNLIDLTPLRHRRPHEEEEEGGGGHLYTGGGNESLELGSGGGGGGIMGVGLAAENDIYNINNGTAEAEAAPAIQSMNFQPRREDMSYIWGTGIAVEEFREQFRLYLENFELRDVQGEGEEQRQASLHQEQQQRQQVRTSASSLHLGSVEGASSLTSLLGPALGARVLQSSSGAASFIGRSAASGTGERYYLKEMLRMHVQGRTTLELDFSWLQHAAPVMYQQTVNHPTECLQMMSAVAEELFRDVLEHRHGIAVPEDVIISVAPKHMPGVIALKQLSPQHLEQLLSVKGMVIRVSRILPEIRVACFQCWNCQYIEKSVSGDKGRIFEPTRCAHCGHSYSFFLRHNLSLYEDKQLIKLQESPEHVSDGETPVSISIVVYGSMVDAVVPGDRVIVTGVYRSVPIRLNANTRIIKSVFATHIDAFHLELVRATRLAESKSSNSSGNRRLNTAVPTTTTTAAGGGGHNDVPTGATAAVRESQHQSGVDTMDAARLDVFHRLAHRPDIYDILLNSFARTIWGHEDVKRGILAQLFGGTPKTFVFNRTVAQDEGHGDAAGPVAQPQQQQEQHRSQSNSAFFRSALNVILCGDPGVAKSQLLTQVHEIAPRGVYTSGKGSSSVGLTAFVVQDHETGELVLEPGALVLSDQGLCCIDEFDKMSEATRSVLHEVMEQQTLSVAKAGIIAQLNARTSILAAANPKESQWNPNLNVVENLQIEPTLLSRFDLIFLLLDRHDPVEDRRLATHVLSLFMDKSGGERTRRAQARLRARGHDVEDDDDDDEGNEGAANGRASTREVAGSPTSATTTATSAAAAAVEPMLDASTGLPIEVLLQHEGEVFLQSTAESGPFMPSPVLSEYIAIARDTVFPRLTEDSHRQLAKSYVELRGARTGRTVSATLRQLESMIRLAEARAKMRYGGTVSLEDVVEAKRLISAALKEAATDPRTGLINMDIFHAADASSNTVEGGMRRLEEVVQKRYVSLGKATAPVAELRLALNERAAAGVRPLSPAQFMELLSVMAGGDCIKSFTGTTVAFAGGEQN